MSEAASQVLADAPLDYEAWWPAALFHSVQPGFPDALDITGPARFLSFGPYVRLAPGLWRAEVELEVCADAAKYDYLIEFGLEGDFSQIIARAPGAGPHVAALTHRLAAPAPVEVRVSLGRAAFHGAFRLIGARLAPAP